VWSIIIVFYNILG